MYDWGAVLPLWRRQRGECGMMSSCSSLHWAHLLIYWGTRRSILDRASICCPTGFAYGGWIEERERTGWSTVQGPHSSGKSCLSLLGIPKYCRLLCLRERGYALASNSVHFHSLNIPSVRVCFESLFLRWARLQRAASPAPVWFLALTNLECRTGHRVIYA